jgi:hypothetical protein
MKEMCHVHSQRTPVPEARLAEDWAELLALIDDRSVVRNLARAPWPYSPADARAFASQPQARRYPHFS